MTNIEQIISHIWNLQEKYLHLEINIHNLVQKLARWSNFQ